MKLVCNIFCLFVLALAVGCGQGELSAEDATLAWQTTKDAMRPQSGSSLALTSALTVSDDVSFPLQCDEGGRVFLKISDSVETDGADVSADVNLEATFEDCVHDGITINGKITYSGSVDTVGTSASVASDYTGSLQYGGDLDGSCEAEMHMSVEVTDTSVDVSSSGSFCGQDAGILEDIEAEDPGLGDGFLDWLDELD